MSIATLYYILAIILMVLLYAVIIVIGVYIYRIKAKADAFRKNPVAHALSFAGKNIDTAQILGAVFSALFAFYLKRKSKDSSH